MLALLSRPFFLRLRARRRLQTIAKVATDYPNSNEENRRMKRRDFLALGAPTFATVPALAAANYDFCVRDKQLLREEGVHVCNRC